jgi:hypothetical protein
MYKKLVNICTPHSVKNYNRKLSIADILKACEKFGFIILQNFMSLA